MKLRFPLVFFAMTAGAVFAAAQTAVTPPPSVTSLGTGFDYSRGDYGFADDTEVFSVPLTLSHETGSWVFSASASYLTIKGPATVVAGSGAPRPTASSESGMGDIYLAATYQVGQVAETVNVSGTVRVKLPTADEDRGLGTGAADYYGELTFYRTFTSVTPFATVGYRVLGDGDTYELRSGLYAAGGAHFRLSPATVFTAMVNWRRPIIAGGDEAVEGLVMVSHDLGERWRFSAYALKGFTDASPDVGAGVQVGYKF
jgi:hypothetical protein